VATAIAAIARSRSVSELWPEVKRLQSRSAVWTSARVMDPDLVGPGQPAARVDYQVVVGFFPLGVPLGPAARSLITACPTATQ
jgi:hypothetical protein